MAFGNLGLAYYSLGDFSKGIEYQAQHLAIAKEMDRAVKGGAYANLVAVHQSLGGMDMAFKCHTLHLAIAKEIRRGLGGGGQCVREPRACVYVAGGIQQGGRVPHAVPGDDKGGGGPGGGGQGVREPDPRARMATENSECLLASSERCELLDARRSDGSLET